MTKRDAPHPVPLPVGEGTAFRGRSLLPLPPHPLADAGTQSCKLAKASLLGEGWGEGRTALFAHRSPRRVTGAEAA